MANKTKEWIQEKVDNILASDENATVEFDVYGTFCKVTSKGWVHVFDDSTNEQIIEEPYKLEENNMDTKIVKYVTLDSTPRSQVEVEKEERVSAEREEEARLLRMAASNLALGEKIAVLLGWTTLSDFCKTQLGSGMEETLEDDNSHDHEYCFGATVAVTGSWRKDNYRTISELEVKRKAFSKYLTFTHYTDVKECTSKTVTSVELYSIVFDWMLTCEH